jgi:GNAT superfamily N-acetyltransferase
VSRFAGPEPLGADHRLNGFRCGRESLEVWLLRHARAASGAGSAKTYVVADAEQEGRAVGYHALTGASIDRREATARAARGMGRHRIGTVLLSRLAVDDTVKGSGIGALLLRDAMERALGVSEEVGIRLLLAHAIDDSARGFYLRFGFEESPTDPLNLQIILKDVRASLGIG